MGIRASGTYELIFENARVPKENLLGEEGHGMKLMFHLMNPARIDVGLQGLAAAGAGEALEDVEGLPPFRLIVPLGAMLVVESAQLVFGDTVCQVTYIYIHRRILSSVWPVVQNIQRRPGHGSPGD